MNLWDEILARIETKVNRHSFYTWFRPTTFVTEDRSSVTVRVPNPLFKDWLMKHYAAVITEAASELKRPNLQLNFVADSQTDAPSIPLGVDEAAALQNGPPPTTQPGPAGLNPRYTFDTFIVGSSNQFAHAACRAVAEAPSRSYNPLFIYGGVGLGKTHLMHAVGHYVLQHDRNVSMTSSFSLEKRARKPSFFTHSTRSTTLKNRSCSAAIVRLMRSRRSRSDCARDSNGA